MLNGIFRYTGDNNPYDQGLLRVRVTETDKEFRLEVIERDMYYTSHTIELFEKGAVRINKTRTPHVVHTVGDDWLVIYPYRAGVPCVFKKEEAAKNCD